MPKLGLTMTEGTIGQWRKREGDPVQKGDVLFSVETDKLTNDIQADEDGYLLKILVDDGDTVPCRTVVAYIGQRGEYFPQETTDVSAEKKQNGSRVLINVSPAAAVLVIGGGPGGYVAAIRAAQLGAKVTLVEENEVGGTCLNVGCVPTKCLLYSAELLANIRERGPLVGVEAERVKVDFARVIEHKNEVTRQLTGGVARLLRENKVEVLKGRASFVSPKTVCVRGAGDLIEKTADRIIIATGSVNAVPPVANVEKTPGCIDSTGALTLEKIPESMVVIGGGVIGLEMSCAYARFGTKVTVVEMASRALPMMDGELTRQAVKYLKQMGISFYFDTAAHMVTECDKGVRVLTKNEKNEELAFEAEKVLIAAGRRPNTEQLLLESAGIRNNHGWIYVNDHMETSVPGVYAIGDCVFGKAQLAHAASAMGEVAAENAMGHTSVYDETSNPTCVYLDPEFAGVGMTEEQAQKRNIDYKVGRFPMMANGKALILNGGQGMVKVVADKKYGEILGIHILGPRATELIAEGALAIRMEATLDELISTIHAHPTVSEVLREAALAAEKRAIHIRN